MGQRGFCSGSFQWNATMISVVSKPEFGGFPGACRFENGVVTADMPSLSVNSYLDDEAVVLRMVMNTVETCFVSLASLHVSAVHGLTNIAQIGNSVITRIAVYVVDVLQWKLAVVIKPCKSMRFPYAAEYGNPDVSSALSRSPHNMASLPSWEYRSELISASIFAASKHASFWIVMHVFFKLVLGNHERTLVKAVEWMRQPLTRWFSGCIPSRETRLTTNSSAGNACTGSDLFAG